MPYENPLDFVIPAPGVVEYHLARVNAERDLLERLLVISREYEEQRERRAKASGVRVARERARDKEA